MIHIFEISEPNLLIHFVTFRALRRRLSHVIALLRLQSSRDMHRVPKTTRSNFVTPNCLSIYSFYRATITIKDSLYLSTPMLR